MEKKNSVTVQSKDEAQVLQKMYKTNPAQRAESFIEKISAIKDSGQFEKYYKKQGDLFAQLNDAYTSLPSAVEEPNFWQKFLLKLPVIGPKVKAKIDLIYFDQGTAIDRVTKLVHKTDRLYVVLRDEVQPTKELRNLIIAEAELYKSEIADLEAYVAENELSEEALEFAKRYIEKQKIVVRDFEDMYIVYLQDAINASEKLYLQYATERRSLHASLVVSTKVLQKVGIVESAADGLITLRDTKKRVDLMTAKAVARMKVKTAEVEEHMAQDLQSMQAIKIINEEAMKKANEVKVLGQAERKEILERMDEFKLEDRGSLGDELVLKLPGGEEVLELKNIDTIPEVEYVEVDQDNQTPKENS